MISIPETAYEVEETQLEIVRAISERVTRMRSVGRLTPEVLSRIRTYFKIKNIYHSNAIEGNILNVGETRLIVEQGLTITGKPLKDQAEAKNLSAAIDFLEQLATEPGTPITETDIRQIHFLVLKNINDANAGAYRTVAVEISGSQFKPPSPESVPAEMDCFGQWLKKASVPNTLFGSDEAVLAASAAHTWLVGIHPFIDGNGRVARLLMNLILMRYGFPIAVVTREDRLRYYDALEASQAADLTPFIALMGECIEESLEEYEAAAKEQREAVEWARSIASKFDHKESVRASNQYEVWKNAMELLKSLFKQSADLIESSAVIGEVFFRDFGILEFEKYLSLKNYGSAKKTWFFRLDFRSGAQTVRFLFFFGSPSIYLRQGTDVTLHISREMPSGSFHYERLDTLGPLDCPDIVEIGYSASTETFVIRKQGNSVSDEKVDSISRNFIQQVIERHFCV